MKWPKKEKFELFLLVDFYIKLNKYSLFLLIWLLLNLTFFLRVARHLVIVSWQKKNIYLVSWKKNQTY